MTIQEHAMLFVWAYRGSSLRIFTYCAKLGQATSPHKARPKFEARKARELDWFRHSMC